MKSKLKYIMKILTMKFGGTSVADIDRIRAVRDIISDEIRDGWNVVAVVSANVQRD